MTTFDDDEMTPEDEPGAENFPTVYVDGVAQEYDDPWDLSRVQVEFDETVNGYATEAQERAPLGWLNSASINLDRDDDACTVTISVGDPRGAFAFTVRRLPKGNSVDPNGEPVLIMHLPRPSDGMPHMPLRPLHEGTYVIG